MASTLWCRLPVLLNILLLLLSTTISTSINSNSDVNTLLTFKSLITKDPMGALSSWEAINRSASNGVVPYFCKWNGVTCSSSLHRHVTALRLRGFGLEGNISQSLQNLSHLEILDLSNNKLEGEIPSSIGNFLALHFLNLSVNDLSGSIPQSIGHLSRLEILNVRHSNIIGGIPTSVLNLTKLTMLSVSDNYLTGNIPSWLGNLTTLTDLNFGLNSFSGQIPWSLGKLTNLVSLTMPLNQLEGTIPPTVYNISSLELFNLGYNKLSGSLPPDIGFTLPNVRKFGVYYNNFVGPVPSSLSNISVLQQLILHGNKFHGLIPPNIGVHGCLTTLELGNNLLQSVETKNWDFLTSLVNCSNLRFLNVELNNMSGILPNTVSNLSHELTWLQMGTNKITGTIPSGIGRFHKLLVLDLSDNLFTSNIPSSIGKLSSLDQLLLFRNKFDGGIPSSLGNLTKLSELVLFSNDLHGSIPTSLGNMSTLASMDLSYNRLSGRIPQEILSMSSITKMLNLSNNLFSGPIYQQIGLLFGLGAMDLSGNNLFGEIPHTLGSCVSLQFLYLQGNLLQGQIPMELNALRGLEVLDISSNNLSGPIPYFLGDFQVLKKLNLSFNNLSGMVLDRGIFHNATYVSLSGNARLCGGPRFFQLSPCPNQAIYGRSNHRRMLILIFCFIGALVVFVCITVSYFMKKASRNVNDAEQGLVTLPNNKYKRITYADLCEATDSFSESNIIGRGRFGTVYKGIFHDDGNRKTVAIKVLDLKQQGASRTFFTECDALRRIKHRNLVKVITVCDGLDNYGEEFKALVLEFISNGTLDEWLHPSALVINRATGRLSLIQRLNIAFDVAEALAYLHHHSNPSIVHCDIKPRNILLDDNMTAHVSDFGLARILNMDSCGQNSGGISSAGIQGTIGYLAPEYAMGHRVGVEGDVYSYGVLLLEILTELRPTDTSFEGATSLVKHVEMTMAYPYRLLEILDATMLQGSTSHSTQEMMDMVIIPVVRIGLACCKNAVSQRIRMDEVVKELNAINKTWQDHFAKITGATDGAADGGEIH